MKVDCIGIKAFVGKIQITHLPILSLSLSLTSFVCLSLPPELLPVVCIKTSLSLLIYLDSLKKGRENDRMSHRKKEIENDNLRWIECNYDISGQNLLLSFKILIASVCMVITPQISACWNYSILRTCGHTDTGYAGHEIWNHIHCRDVGSWHFSWPGKKQNSRSYIISRGYPTTCGGERFSFALLKL